MFDKGKNNLCKVHIRVAPAKEPVFQPEQLQIESKRKEEKQVTGFVYVHY